MNFFQNIFGADNRGTEKKQLPPKPRQSDIRSAKEKEIIKHLKEKFQDILIYIDVDFSTMIEIFEMEKRTKIEDLYNVEDFQPSYMRQPMMRVKKFSVLSFFKNHCDNSTLYMFKEYRSHKGGKLKKGEIKKILTSALSGMKNLKGFIRNFGGYFITHMNISLQQYLRSAIDGIYHDIQNDFINNFCNGTDNKGRHLMYISGKIPPLPSRYSLNIVVLSGVYVRNKDYQHNNVIFLDDVNKKGWGQL